MFLKLIRITETIALASLLLLICAPNLALCLRFASALWPERHKSYTAVFGARDRVLFIFNGNMLLVSPPPTP